jgi:hypothetical protein
MTDGEREAYRKGYVDGAKSTRVEMRVRMTQALLDMAAEEHAAQIHGNASGPGSVEAAQ